MRRRAGTLLPIEVSILAEGLRFSGPGRPGFHGFAIAKSIQERERARLLTAHGTLYKALRRLERAGLLTSVWEDPQIAADEGRPRRRLYHVTGAGELALGRAMAARSPAASSTDPGLAPAFGAG